MHVMFTRNNNKFNIKMKLYDDTNDNAESLFS